MVLGFGSAVERLFTEYSQHYASVVSAKAKEREDLLLMYQAEVKEVEVRSRGSERSLSTLLISLRLCVLSWRRCEATAESSSSR